MSNILKGLNEQTAFEGTFILTETRTYKLWESAGQKLMEAQLTADQINQIFQWVEQDVTAGGNNRTMLGKGKDAAGAAITKGKDAAIAVNKAWEDLKTKVQNSGPIQNLDAQYDKAAEKLKQATGGDQGVMQYVQKYRDFAKKHPVAQSLIYSALIAAAGISGAGLGGAAALGLFKMVDKLLQGEKFSSAAYSGAKTGAMAYGASKLGDVIKGAQQAAQYGGEEILPVVGQQAADAATNAASGAADVATSAASNIASQGLGAGMNAFKDPAVMNSLAKAAATGGREAVLAQINQVAPAISQNAKQMMIDVAMKKAGLKESVNLSEAQVFFVIGSIVQRQQLQEGIMDTIKGGLNKAGAAVKGAVGKAANYAATKGKNLTNKVTADKLLQAWKKAGSPTDSLDVASIIQRAGVSPEIIKQVYADMQIPAPGQPGGGASGSRKIDVDPSSVTPNAQGQQTPKPAQAAAGQTPAPAATPTSGATAQPTNQTPQPAGATAGGQTPQPGATAQPTGNLKQVYAQARSLLDQLDDKSQERVVNALKNDLEMAVAEGQLDENLHKWFKEKWVRFGPDGKIRGSCARGDDSEGKPKCLPQAKAHALGKKGRKYAASKKRREDPNPERRGPAKNVATKKKSNEGINEGLDYNKRQQLIRFLAKKLDWEVSYLELASDANLISWYKKVQAGKDPMKPVAEVYNAITGALLSYDEKNKEQGVAGGLNEFAPPGSNDGDDGFSEETLKRLAAQWYNGDEDPRVERILMAAGWEIGQDEGYDDEPGVFVVQSGDVNGSSYISWPADELRQGVAGGLNEFAPAGGGGNIPRGPKTPKRGPWDDSGEDPYQLRRYNRSIDFFDQFDSDGVDKQKFDKATGEYEGYYFDRDAASGITQIAYFKFDDPTKIGDNDPGIGWYYEPVDESLSEQELDEACWKGYHKEGNKKMFGKTYPNCVKNTNESEEGDLYVMALQRYPKLKQVDRELVVSALNNAYEDYLMHYGYEGIGPDEENSLIDYAIKNMKHNVNEYGDTAKGQKMLTKVQKRAVDRMIKADDKRDAKNAKKNQDTANRAWDRMTDKDLEEAWSQKYKDSINCSNPKGFSQKAHCAGKKKNEDIQEEKCPECGGPMFSELLINEKKDACYYKVKSRYKVWPSAYASGALVKCRKKGASNWGTGGKKNESIEEKEADYGPEYQDMVTRVGQKAKAQDAKKSPEQRKADLERLAKRLNQPEKKSNILRGIEENLGTPYPSTYEEENDPFKRKGSYRITAMTSESKK